MYNSFNYPSATEQNTIFSTIIDTAKIAVSKFAKTYAHLFTREEVEDIAGDAILKAVRYYNSFDREKGTLRTWVSSIASNCVIDAADSKRKRLPISCSVYSENVKNGEEFGVGDFCDERYGFNPELWDMLSEYDAEKDLYRKEFEECVNTQCSKLNEQNRRFIKWTREGYGTQEMAEEEGCSASAAAKRLWGIRQALKGPLSEIAYEFGVSCRKYVS